jgi:general secretion pathway protein C
VVRSELRLRLVAALAFSDPSWSRASIVEEGKAPGDKATIYSLNDCVTSTMDPADPNAALQGKPPPCNRVTDSALLKRIEPEKVFLWNETEHRYEYLALDEPPEKGAAPRVAAKVDDAPPGGGEEIGAHIRKTSDTSFDIGEDDLGKALNNLSQLATEARIVPAFEGGKSVGFKLFSIRPGSLFSKIGLQNGDVIGRINGYEMTSPDKALEVYQKLKDSKRISVDVKRRGKPVTMDYSITP